MGALKLICMLLVGAAMTERGRDLLRKGMKEAVKAGHLASEKGAKLFSELKETTAELVDEVKAEQAQEKS